MSEKAATPENYIRAQGGAMSIVASADGATKKTKMRLVAYTGSPLDQWWSPYRIVPDYSGMKANPSMPCLYAHRDSIDSIVGQITSVKVENGEIICEAECLDEEDDEGITAQVLRKARAGFRWQVSIGAPITRSERVEAGVNVIVNGREYTGPLLIAREFLLQEVSLVVLGADPLTSAAVAAGAQKRGTNMSQTNTTETTVGSSSNAASVSINASASNAAAEANAARQNIRDIAAQEASRIDAIRAVCEASPVKMITVNGQQVSLLAHAIQSGWDSDRTELEALRAGRPNPATVQQSGGKGSTGGFNARLIEASIGIVGGLSDQTLTRSFGEETLEAARKRYPGGVSLQEMLIEAARESGWSGYTFPRTGPGIHSVLRAAFSTLSLPGIFSNNMNKFLLMGWSGVESSWRMVCTVRPVRDFKTITSYRMTADMTYAKVGPTGELQHGEVGEETYTNQAETYGRMFSITRQDIINDDLGALTQLPRDVGRGAALKLNSVFWTEFMDNSSFFTSGRGNYSTGSGTALSSASLGTALQLFRKQTDSKGNSIFIEPRILLTPVELEITALELLRSIQINTGGSSTETKVPNANIWAGKYEPAVARALSNSGFTGYSAKAWYLLADPRDEATMEVVFLNGIEVPTVETADAVFDTLGIQMRGYHDFGVAKKEYRAGVKMKGEA